MTSHHDYQDFLCELWRATGRREPGKIRAGGSREAMERRKSGMRESCKGRRRTRDFRDIKFLNDFLVFF